MFVIRWIAWWMVLFLLMMAYGAAPVAEHNAIPAESTALQPTEPMMLFAAETSAELLEEAQNQCFSPLGLYMSAALAAEGAQGETKEELLSFLHAEDRSMKQLEDDIKNIMVNRQFRVTPVYTQDMKGIAFTERKLSLTNALWIDDEFKFNDQFYQTASYTLHAGLKNIDFADSAAPGEISDWLGRHTNGRIVPEISGETGDEQAGMLFVNMLELQDAWICPFDQADNTPNSFHLATGEEITCTYMYQSFTTGFSYICEPGFTGAAWTLYGQSVEKGFGKTGRMVFILPDEGISLSDFTADDELLCAALTAEQDVHADAAKLWLPKFSIDSRFETKDAMRELGVVRAFDSENAQFSGMLAQEDSDDPLYIDAIIQETHIGIAEQGVDADSQIEYDGLPSGVRPQDILELRFDRPFLFYVEYDGIPVFVGTVYRPSA